MFRLLANAALPSRLRTRAYAARHQLRPQAYPVLAVPRRYLQTNSSTSPSPPTCPACSNPLPTALPICPKCLYISNIPKSMSYHEMLGASYTPNPFIVDPSQLKSKFRQVQSVVHPDRWAGRSKVCISNSSIYLSSCADVSFSSLRTSKLLLPSCLPRSMLLFIT